MSFLRSPVVVGIAIIAILNAMKKASQSVLANVERLQEAASLRKEFIMLAGHTGSTLHCTAAYLPAYLDWLWWDIIRAGLGVPKGMLGPTHFLTPRAGSPVWVCPT